MNPAPPPRVVIKNNTARDVAVTIVSVLLLLSLLAFGVMQLREKPRGNALRGEIVEKVFTPMKEEIVEFSGRRLKSTRESAGEFVLRVRVEAEGGRIFDVPVTPGVYALKKQGDALTFLRPKTEQK